MSEAGGDQLSARKKGGPVRRLFGFTFSLVATVIAAVALVLPWGIRIQYGKLLRWVRNGLMQNVKFVRRWALRKRWEWDSHEA